MEFFETVVRRRSYRGPMKPEPVPRDDLRRIVEAGLLAPSGCNAQTTRFVIVDDPATVEAIKTIVNRPFLATVPAFIVCVMDPRSRPNTCSFAVEDCAAATENMLLAITALGYASVWIDGALRAPAIKKALADLLHLPEGFEARILLPVGKPAGEMPPPKERLPFEKRAFFNRFGNDDASPAP
jgi:nitroreductase